MTRKPMRPTGCQHSAMSSTSKPFDQLLAAAAAQPEPQTLLFVFATAELPPDATPAQRARFQQGAGGTLTPLMCVEKTLDELSTFDALVEESREAGPPWQVLFAAGLSGHGGQPPAGPTVEAALRELVGRVRAGAVDGLLALSAEGELLQFH
jgi:hypothetical protein